MATLSLRTILDSCKLTNTNFDDWYRNLRIVLKHEKLIYVIDEPSPDAPLDDADPVAIDTYKKWVTDSNEVQCIMFSSIGSDLQRQHEDMDPVVILARLRQMYGAQIRPAMYDLGKGLFRATMTHGTPVSSHVIQMIDMIERLEKYRIYHHSCIQQYLILQSLPDTFSQFIVNYHMNGLDTTPPQLLNMIYPHGY